MRRHYETFTIYCHIYCFTGWTGIVRASAEWFGLRNLIILSVGVLESELLFALNDGSGSILVSFVSKMSFLVLIESDIHRNDCIHPHIHAYFIFILLI